MSLAAAIDIDDKIQSAADAIGKTVNFFIPAKFNPTS
jgi:hypothetical protein